MLCGNFENEPPIYSTIEDCKKSLEKAVIDRCMADVEVGLFLSGGLGMISHKKSLITIFGHKHEIKNFIKKFDIFHFSVLGYIWNKITNFESKLH